ncbi:MAG: hypothetical protein ACYC9L_06675 [Sulfuricaulis sp.]
MIGLLTLPRMPARALHDTREAGLPVRMGVSAHTRALAARALANALANGRIGIKQARKAMGEGDAAVAQLLRPFTARYRAPVMQAGSLDGLPQCCALESVYRENLISLAHRLCADGDASAQTLIDLAAGRPDDARFLDCLHQAWNRRCARLIRAALPQTPDDAYTCYAVTPVAFAEALDALSGYGSSYYSLDPSERSSHGVLVELTNWPLVRMPAHPVQEPEFFRAFTGAWNALGRALGPLSLLWNFDPSLIHLAGGFGEVFEDAIATARWDGDTPALSRESESALREEYGFEDIEDLLPQLAAFRRWKIASDAKPLTPGSPAFARFLEDRATPAQAALIQRLRDLTCALVKRPRIEPERVERAYAGDGIIECALTPRNFGIDDYVLPSLDGMYESGETPVLQFALKSEPNATQFWRFADAVIVAVAIATAAINEVGNYAGS